MNFDKWLSERVKKNACSSVMIMHSFKYIIEEGIHSFHVGDAYNQCNYGKLYKFNDLYNNFKLIKYK